MPGSSRACLRATRSWLLGRPAQAGPRQRFGAPPTEQNPSAGHVRGRVPGSSDSSAWWWASGPALPGLVRALRRSSRSPALPEGMRRTRPRAEWDPSATGAQHPRPQRRALLRRGATLGAPRPLGSARRFAASCSGLRGALWLAQQRAQAYVNPYAKNYKDQDGPPPAHRVANLACSETVVLRSSLKAG